MQSYRKPNFTDSSIDSASNASSHVGKKESSKSSGGNLNNDMEHLFKSYNKKPAYSDMHLQNDLTLLRKKYNDEEYIDKIQEAFTERLSFIKSKAKQFARAFWKKYKNQQSSSKLMSKAQEYKKKYNLSEAEFFEFSRVFKFYMDGQEVEVSSFCFLL